MSNSSKLIIIFFLYLIFLGSQISAQCTDPVSPLNGASGVNIPVVLDWCSVSGANSYQLRIFEVSLDENNNEIEADFSLQVVKLSEACIQGFNSSTTYRWQTTGCTGDDGSGCSGFGPKWEFTADGNIVISPPSLSSPANGSTVSLPVDLDWSDVASAKSYYYEIYKGTDLTDSGVTTASTVSVGLEPLTKNTTYAWKVASCFDTNGKRCGVNCCANESGSKCADFSSQISFTTDDSITLETPVLSAPHYDPDQPSIIPLVSPSDYLIWIDVAGADFYYYEVLDSGTVVIGEIAPLASVKFNTIFDQLNEDAVYDWHVKSCWGDQESDCETTWSETWKFKTASQTPSIQYPADGSSDVTIPINFDWTDTPGANSYQYEISSSSDTLTGVVLASNIEFDHTKINLSTNYSWKVRACFDVDNTQCSDWSNVHTFTTITLVPPTNPNPVNGGTLFTYNRTISWEPALGANSYRYKIDYASKSSEETDQNCIAGTTVISPSIVSSNSANINLNCLGTYNWWVESCLDKDCAEATGLANSPAWGFDLIQPTPPAKFGLVPCNRLSDDPNTPWNERNPCSFEHLFIIMKNILDFLLWRLSLVVFVLLIIATAIDYYVALGERGIIINIKSLWSAAAKAFAMMFLAWIIITLILAALGYKIPVFGNWWIIDFNK